MTYNVFGGTLNLTQSTFEKLNITINAHWRIRQTESTR